MFTVPKCPEDTFFLFWPMKLFLCLGCSFLVFFFFFLFSLFGFYGPFKNISFISSRSFIKGGQKPENPGKKHLTMRKQNFAFPRDPSEARTIAGETQWIIH